MQISFKFRGTFGCLLAPTYVFRISYRNVRRHSDSLFVAYLSVAYATTELHPRNATLSTNVLFCPVRHIKAESVVPVRIRHVVPEIRVGESGIRPVPEIAAPVCDKSYFKIISVYYLEGAAPSFACAKFTPKRFGIKRRERSSSTQTSRRPRDPRRRTRHSTRARESRALALRANLFHHHHYIVCHQHRLNLLNPCS